MRRSAARAVTKYLLKIFMILKTMKLTEQNERISRLVNTLSSNIKATVENYMREEQLLLHKLEELKARQTEPSAEIGRTILSELGGAMAGEFFGSKRAASHGRRIAKAFLGQKQKEAPQVEERAIEIAHQQCLHGILSFLSGISVDRPRLKESNSRALMDQINKAQNHVRLETRIRNTAVAMQSIANKDLISNTEIPELSSEQTIGHITDTQSYKTLKELENKLRQCIQIRLQGVTPNWWNERIPADVRQNAGSRKNKNEKTWPWHEQRDLHPIFYVDFMDYIKIVCRKDNWPVFQPIFRDTEIFSAKLKELEPIRNAIAHNRELARVDKERLKLHASDIITGIQQRSL